MPLTPPKRKVSDAENKLRVLLCVDALGMVTQEQLWPFVAALDLMEYLPFCLFVDELTKDGALSTGEHALAGMLYLTATGAKQLALFEQRVPASDRVRIRAQAPAYVSQLNERKQVRTAYELAPSGFRQALFTVQEGDVPTLLCRISLREGDVMSNMVHGFRTRASRVVLLLYTLMPAETPTQLVTCDSLEGAMAEATPEQPTVFVHGKHEVSATVRLVDGERATYALSVLLPSLEAAAGWATAALDPQNDLAAKLTAALLGKEDAS